MLQKCQVLQMEAEGGSRRWLIMLHGFQIEDTDLNTSAPQGLDLMYAQWHPTPVLLPGKSHGWRSLVGCSP